MLLSNLNVSDALQAKQTEELLHTNEVSERFGLILTPADARAVVQAHHKSLQNTHRVEFEDTVTPKLVFAFCDSPFIGQHNYAETLAELTEIFFTYKNEFGRAMSDDELIDTMVNAFNGRCQGSTEVLGGTVLDDLRRRLRGLDAEGPAAQEEEEEDD